MFKRRANPRKRGIDFADAERISRGSTLTAGDRREAYGERRFLTLGPIRRSGRLGPHTPSAVRSFALFQFAGHET
jgi:uncharacterized DUF497 family protein